MRDPKSLRLMLVYFDGVILAGWNLAYAADVTLRWDASQGDATGYKVYQSIDGGVTWDAGTDVGNVTQTIMTSVAEDSLILFRISAYNTATESIRGHSGAWYDHRILLDSPSGAGIE